MSLDLGIVLMQCRTLVFGHQGLSTNQAVNCILRTPGMESKKGAMRLLLRHLTSSPPGSGRAT